jgi:flagellar assembly protein FliH
MSKVLSKDELQGLRAWAPPAMDPATPMAGDGPGIHGGGMATASEIETLQQQAYEEAYAAGLAEGRAAGQRESEARARQLDQLMVQLAQPFRDLDTEVEEQLVGLVIAMVKQLVRRELKADPGQIMAVVREAMEALPSASRNVRMHLHPDDAALVRESLSLSEQERAWTIVEDPLLSRGGCRVLNDNSRIDASVETRVAQLVAKTFGGERGTD